jgi:hypothetical protein
MYGARLRVIASSGTRNPILLLIDRLRWVSLSSECWATMSYPRKRAYQALGSNGLADSPFILAGFDLL